MTSQTASKSSPEVRARAARMVLEYEGASAWRWTAVQSVATKIGCSPHTLLDRVKKAEVDNVKRADGCRREAEGP